MTEVKLSLDILTTVQKSQQQNGLRHDDYQRYRQYCSRRLRRVRRNKLVQFTNTSHRGTYTESVVTPEVCTNSLFLMLPLYTCERAWAYAMQLKQHNTTQSNTAQQHSSEQLQRHLIGRLRKAAQEAEKLRVLCSTLCDDLTMLQVQGYCHFMKGTFYLEKDDLQLALAEFASAKSIYEKLTPLSTIEQQAILSSKLEELNLVVLYCKRYLSMDGFSTDEITLQYNTGFMKNKLDKVKQESLEKLAHQGFNVNLGKRVIAVRNEETAVLILAAQSNLDSLDTMITTHFSKEQKSSSETKPSNSEQSTEKAEKNFDNIDNLFIDTFSKYEDGGKLVNQDLKKLNEESTQDQFFIEELKSLGQFLKLSKLDAVLKRNLLLVRNLANKVTLTALGTTPPEDGKKGKRAVRPLDIVRTYDKIIHNLNDKEKLLKAADLQPQEKSAEQEKTTDVKSDGKFTDLQSHEKDVAKLRIEVLAQRSFFIGVEYVEQKKWVEALSVLEKAQALVAESEDPATLKDLDVKIRTYKCFAQASDFVNKIQKDPTTSSEEQQETKLQPNKSLMKTPPAMNSMGCRPVLFDAAINYMQQDAGSTSTTQQRSTKAASTAGEKKEGWLGRATGWFGNK